MNKIIQYANRMEYLPLLVGLAVFLIVGILGYHRLGDRIVFIPAGFLAGFAAGITTDQVTNISFNGIIAILLGYLSAVGYATASRVAEEHAADPMSLGDMAFFGTALFLTEVAVTGIFVFGVGYIGIMVAEAVTMRLGDHGRDARDFSQLGK